MKRRDDPGDELNLKTPSGVHQQRNLVHHHNHATSGPQPHPSWVYRNNYAPFGPASSSSGATSQGRGHATSSPVKRTLSALRRGHHNSKVPNFDQRRAEINQGYQTYATPVVQPQNYGTRERKSKASKRPIAGKDYRLKTRMIGTVKGEP